MAIYKKKVEHSKLLQHMDCKMLPTTHKNTI